MKGVRSYEEEEDDARTKDHADDGKMASLHALRWDSWQIIDSSCNNANNNIKNNKYSTV